jgi:hypothetical protein
MVEIRVIYTGVRIFDLRIDHTQTGDVGCHIWRRGHWFHVNVSFQWGFCDPLDIILVLRIFLDVRRRKGFTLRVSYSVSLLLVLGFLCSGERSA